MRFGLVGLERRFFGFNGKKKLVTDTRLFVFNRPPEAAERCRCVRLKKKKPFKAASKSV